MKRRATPIIARALVAAGLLAATLIGALSARAGGGTTVYIPMVRASGAPAPTPQPAPLPAGLVGTWFSGRLMNLTHYNRDTGTWSGSGGLGHTYTLKADGTYTHLSHLELGPGTACKSTVTAYDEGRARAVDGSLLLTPTFARTRTFICGTGATVTEGSRETISIPWRLGEDQYRHTRLWLTEAHGETQYYKDGLGEQVVGSWANGDGGAVGLFDPASGTWSAPTGADSEWYELRADGTYRHGRVDADFGDDPCRTVRMSYDEGALSGSGGDIVMRPSGAAQIAVSLCDPASAVEQQPSVNSYERWTWAFGEDAQGTRLDLLRIEGGFSSISLRPIK